MGKELTNLSCEDLCDLMCGQVEQDYDDRDCEKCKHYKQVKNEKYKACEKWECKFEEVKNEG